MRSTMNIGIQGSRQNLEKILTKLLQDKKVRIIYVSWDIGERGHKEVASK
jgi:hypothetical protein